MGERKRKKMGREKWGRKKRSEMKRERGKEREGEGGRKIAQEKLDARTHARTLR